MQHYPEDGTMRERGGRLDDQSSHTRKLRRLIDGDPANIAARQAQERQHTAQTDQASVVTLAEVGLDPAGYSVEVSSEAVPAPDPAEVHRLRQAAIQADLDAEAAADRERAPKPASWPSVRALLDARLEAAEALGKAAEDRVGMFRRLISKARTLEQEAQATTRTLRTALDDAKAQEEAAMARCDAARSALAESDRSIPELADQAAGGDTTAEKRLVKVREVRGTQADLLAAHERRAREVAAAREAAEAALFAHLATAQAEAERMCEAVMVATAEHTDAMLREAVETTRGIEPAFTMRRASRPREPWAVPMLAGTNLFAGLARVAADAVAAATGELQSRGVQAATLAGEARRAIECWAQGRGVFPRG